MSHYLQSYEKFANDTFTVANSLQQSDGADVIKMSETLSVQHDPRLADQQSFIMKRNIITTVLGAACALTSLAETPDALRFDPENYKLDSITMPHGNVVKFKAYENIYCESCHATAQCRV